MYEKELELMIEHQGDQTSYLNVDVTFKKGLNIYKLFDKKDAFPSWIVRMLLLSTQRCTLFKNLFLYSMPHRL